MTAEQGMGGARSPWAEHSCPRVVVIAASAGGLPPLIAVISGLPANFPAAVVVVQHRSEGEPEGLIRLLGRRAALKVTSARHGDLLEAGTVYVCPPGVHMTAEHCIRLHDGPRLDYVRPSADLMLASVARTYRDRAIAVVLSGSGHDGAAGCHMLSGCGGTVVAQAPDSCQFADMPAAAIARGAVDEILPIESLAGALIRRLSLEGAVATPHAAPTISVVLADDHRIMLDGLRALLAPENDMEVVATAEDGRNAVELATKLAPDVVVIDIAMPAMDGIEATSRIKTRRPKTRILGLSARSDSVAASQLAKAGASGLLGKGVAFAELATAIRAVAAHQLYFKSGGQA